MDFFLTLSNVLVLFLLILIGFIVGRKNLVDQLGQAQISKLVLYVTMPATIIVGMQLDFAWDKLILALKIIAIMIFFYVLIFFLSSLLIKRFKLEKNQKDILLAGSIMGNNSFMGYPLVIAILGQEALFYAVLSSGLLYELISWSLGSYIIGRNAREKQSFSAKKILLSPGIISLLIGLVLFLGQIKLPAIAFNTLKILSGATSPLAMLVVGMMLSRSDFKQAFSSKYIYLISGLKLLGFPLMIALISNLIGLEGYLKIIPLLMFSLPTGAYVGIFSDNMGNDTGLASQLIFVSSLLSVVTIPLITLLI